jgi:hypothetical protein
MAKFWSWMVAGWGARFFFPKPPKKNNFHINKAAPHRRRAAF